MMYVGKDGMNAACGKLDQALGGANYLGIYFFIQFPQMSKRKWSNVKSQSSNRREFAFATTVVFHAIMLIQHENRMHATRNMVL